MRRKDKEITDLTIIESILNDAKLCRIALCENNMPYVVPMSFGYQNNCIYIHSASEGKKIGIIKKNNNICFEVTTGTELVEGERACNWGMKYKSVIGFGKAYVIEDCDEKRKALDTIMWKYSGKTGFEYTQEALNRVTVIKIAIENMTGKKSG